MSTIPDGSAGGCSCFGIMVVISYQVLDQNGQAINSSALEPQEKITDVILNGQSYPGGDWGDIGPSEYPGTSKYTDSTGKFLDAPFGVCTSVEFTETFTQQIRMLVSDFLYYNVRTNYITVSSGLYDHGSISNGSDISKSR